MIKRILIIGPAGIGKIHLREFFKLGYNEFGILGRSNKIKRSFNVTLTTEKKILIHNLKNFCRLSLSLYIELGLFLNIEKKCSSPSKIINISSIQYIFNTQGVI